MDTNNTLEKVLPKELSEDEYFIPQDRRQTTPGVSSSVSQTYYVSAGDCKEIDALPDWLVGNIVTQNPGNETQDFSGFLQAVYSKLPIGGGFVSSIETEALLKQRLFHRYTRWKAWFIYFWTTGYNRYVAGKKWARVLFHNYATSSNYMSKTEVMGRLAHAGFKLQTSQEFNNLLYIFAVKTDAPTTISRSSCSFLLKMKRVGQHGKLKYFYKFRTMHPYAEYLQSYIYRQNKLQKNGKFNDDFRITFWGRFMRKYWIDELPMLINWLKGDVKLVGVRPLSEQYLSLYPESFIPQRLKAKPGLVPPFYADMPDGLNEIIESEKKYLDAYQQRPLLTDVRYFFKSFYNIFFKNARSL